MSVVPCKQNKILADQIDSFAEALRKQAYTLGDHGLSEVDFSNSGIFRGAIEKIRGQFISNQGPAREFAERILNHMMSSGVISEWERAESGSRYGYTVTLPSDRVAVIRITGCTDGNNANLYQRPKHADEFIVWIICESPGANLGGNVWSGLHSRMSANIISRQQVVDGVIVWGMMCGSASRPCPKIKDDPSRMTEVGPYRLPPPCIYMLPEIVPTLPSNDSVKSQNISGVQFLLEASRVFKVSDSEIFSVDFDVSERDSRIARMTTVRRGNVLVRKSKMDVIKSV